MTSGRNGCASLIFFAIIFVSLPTELAAQWNLNRLPAAAGGRTRCTVETPAQAVFDGYNDSKVWIEVDAAAVFVRSDSPIDMGFADVGLRVGNHDLIRADRIERDRAAVFQSQYPLVVEQFKKGARVVAQLRFWPTWPTTGIHETTFSLVPFTRAYEDLTTCTPQ